MAHGLMYFGGFIPKQERRQNILLLVHYLKLLEYGVLLSKGDKTAMKSEVLSEAALSYPSLLS